jgi:hypothetical protein
VTGSVATTENGTVVAAGDGATGVLAEVLAASMGLGLPMDARRSKASRVARVREVVGRSSMREA